MGQQTVRKLRDDFLDFKPSIQRTKTSEMIMKDIEKGLATLKEKEDSVNCGQRNIRMASCRETVTLSVVSNNTDLRKSLERNFRLPERNKGCD